MLPLKIACFVVCVSVVFVYFYTPVPDGMNEDDRWILRKIFALSQAGKVVARLGALVGYDSAINITRSFRNSRFAFVHPDNYALDSTNYDFEGVNVTVHRRPRAKDAKELDAAFVYIHGGGWAYEYREIYAILERYIAQHADVAVVAIQYPLAPENPYPKPMLACYNSVLYLHQHAQRLGIDPQRISIGGDSAGGNLAASVTLKLRDTGHTFLQRQILLSPALQFATFRLDSYEQNDRYGILPRRDMILFWLHYMHEGIQFINELTFNEHLSPRITQGKIWPVLQKYQQFPQSHVKIDEKVVKNWEKKLLDPYLCPMFADTLKGLPPTVILISEFDILRDEALAYADRLKADGVETKVVRTPGFHGLYCFSRDSKVGAQMADAVVSFLKTPVPAQQNHAESSR
ncbi:arylacetamide deacetylase-like [Paramacrobiotus metropolitanus]|uniref:arylacetamide deacetylase-like n=1 Tax=Paramacrobiotus metropolitanus TaxID=2943436 RepID=UPI002445D62E|nr:arylacetamide deacetylase-like [Paramacrobiotus metropolitanus]